MTKNNSHLIIDANETPSVMRCLDCGDSHPLVQTRLTTAICLMKAFEDAHSEMGCSEESYLKKKLLKDIEPVDDFSGGV